eukprot:Polyplicarium_translucidae@DN2783_c0_g1_i1.p2
MRLGGRESEKLDRLDRLEFFFPEEQRIDLTNPDSELCLLEVQGSDNSRGMWPAFTLAPLSAPGSYERPFHIFFGRVVGSNQRWWWRYRLGTRRILGPTTLDNDLGFLMMNAGQVRRSSVVVDPFCGTGGVLLCAAHLGAECFGGDIDRRVLMGWGVSQRNKQDRDQAKVPTDVFQNFVHYGLPKPDVVACDNSQPAWRNRGPWIDAVVTDPPYGIRARAVKSSGDELRRYGDDQIRADLLAFAATGLVDGGRLSFLLPVPLPVDEAAVRRSLEHPALELLALELQVVQLKVGRFLVVMRRSPRP